MQVYLDNSATTKPDPRILDQMQPYFSEKYGNASSIHFMGDEGTKALDEARKLVAGILNCGPANIIFTSGASESNNLIIKGVARAHKSNKGKRDTILISEIEHSSVLAPAKQLMNEGFKIKHIPVDKNGQIQMKEFEKMVDAQTLLVSVMTVNNEIGTIQDIESLVRKTHEKGALFHTDAVQAVPYLDIDINQSGVDFLSLSAHKFYGPKGVGLAFINRIHEIQPLIDGGEQEYGIRSGTYNIPGIVGMAEALSLAYQEKNEHLKKITELSNYMWDRMSSEIQNIHLNGSLENRTPNNLNVRFESVEGEAIVIELSTKGICVGTGSACSAKDLRSSHVLKSIGLKDEHLNSNVRFTLGKFNTKQEIDYTVDALKEVVKRLRSFTPIK
jgi:cysteine desulfurase